MRVYMSMNMYTLHSINVERAYAVQKATGLS